LKFLSFLIENKDEKVEKKEVIEEKEKAKTPKIEEKTEDLKEEEPIELKNKESLEKLPGNENLSAFQIADRKKRTVFVGNIPVEMTPKKLWRIFKACGKIEKIWFRSIAPSTMITDRRNIGKFSLKPF